MRSLAPFSGSALLECRYADAKDILSRELANETIAMSSTDAIENRGTLLLVLGLTQQRAGDVAAAHATYQQVVRPYLVIAARMRKAKPTTPKTKLTIQKLRRLVRAEIAAMAMAIWNIVTPRANTSCL